jgi:anti-sigma B factor antagonist
VSPVGYGEFVELSVTESHDPDGRHVLRLTGSLDYSSRDLVLQAAGEALGGANPAGLVLDLAGISFFDSSAIGAVVQIAGEASDAEVPFALRAPSDRVMRVLTIAGLLDAWPVENASGGSDAE